MKTSPAKRFPRGFVSFLLVLTTGALLTMLMIFAYRSALHSQAVQSQVQLRVDYSEKEEAILRSIVAITPNRAIKAMQTDPDTTELSWESIFTDSLEQANVRTSIPEELKTSLGIAKLKSGNSGDSTVPGLPSAIFQPAFSPAAAEEPGSPKVFVSAGINRAKVSGYPPALTTSDTTTSAQDVLCPIISDRKMGVGLADGTTPNFNVLKYPNINFGYAKPGDDFVAKRNWWAFSVDAGAQDAGLTHLARKKRNFVLSIYEVPSQLAISASSFMSLGKYAGGAAWEDVKIEGGIFAGKAELLGETPMISALASRRGGMTMDKESTIGGVNFTDKNPFTPGDREKFQVDNAASGAFFPVSLASESGRAAFIPINRGAAFFDRHAHTVSANKAQSTTTWNDYSIGALQCAMRLDILEVNDVTAVPAVPTVLQFEYYGVNGGRGTAIKIALDGIYSSPPEGAKQVAAGVEPLPGQSVDFISKWPDGLYHTIEVSGAVEADGFWLPKSPFSINRNGLHIGINVSPELLPTFLAVLGGAPVGPPPAGSGGVTAPHYNNSLVVNVDYVNNIALKVLNSLPLDAKVGVVLTDCGDLTEYTSGFSLVTNLRLFVGDNFNTEPISKSNPNVFPPCSLFSPERRIGFERDPLTVTLKGQIGSLASEDDSTAVRPLDTKTGSGNALAANQITVNLSKIDTVEELPPITMMNWLVLLEEVRTP